MRAAASVNRTLRSAPSGVLDDAWTVTRGEGPILAVALHDGHGVRKDISKHLALPEAVRLREEDPWTAEWTRIAPTRIVVRRSRFEIDLNRPVEDSVYLRPDRAWNLEVWKEGGPPEWVVQAGHEIHAAFYAMLEKLLRDVEARHGRFVVYDLHSYNHRRGGPHSPPDDSRGCPDINLGTGSMDRGRWAPVVDAFLQSLSSVELLGRPLDARENVRFRGGYLSRWVHQTFPRTGCVLAVEVKKLFMDEWTGEVEPSMLEAVGSALGGTVPAVKEVLERL
jgi:N-formylglutamate amidohydrolase